MAGILPLSNPFSTSLGSLAGLSFSGLAALPTRFPDLGIHLCLYRDHFFS